MRRIALLVSFLAVGCDRGVDSSPTPSDDDTVETSAPGVSPHGPNPHADSPHAADPHGGRIPGAPDDAVHGGGSATPPAAMEMPPAPPFDARHPDVGGITWTAPSGFTYRQPTVAMRLAEYVVGRAGDADIVMTVFHFPGMGGSIDSNVERWLGQFTQPDGSSTLAAARLGTQQVNGLRVTTVDVGGTYSAGSMGGGSGENHRLLGAIVESSAGPVFFKLVGPRAAVDSVEPGFRALIASFAPSTSGAR